ncbi:MAG TPA: MmcQ/YjbR family DNA-binding protein [Gemmatimonadaceae bacterium]|nr:MmcQ/YjbR family DNA-binding protein [Gemmatimonadaceae bacterium]
MKLPDVEEGTTFGFPAFKVGGKTFAWFPKKKEVEAGSLGVRMSILEREYRIGAEPSVYYVTPHYKDYPSVLARVPAMPDKALRELLESGHEFMTVSAKSRAGKRPAKKRR